MSVTPGRELVPPADSTASTPRHPLAPAAGFDAAGLEPPAAFGARNLLKEIRQRWVLAALVGVPLMLAVGAAAWALVPLRYTAYALVRVAPVEPELLPDHMRASVGTERYFENTQVALIKSRPIVLAALRRPGVGELPSVRVQPDPATWLEQKLSVGFIDKTDILRVGLDGDNPAELATLVNAVVEAYMAEAVNAQRNQRLGVLEDLEKVHDESEKNIRNHRTALKALTTTLQSSDPQALGLKHKAVLEELAALRKELAGVQSLVRGAELTLTAPAAADPRVPDALLDEVVEADRVVSQHREALAQHDVLAAQTAKAVRPGDPQLAKLEADRKVLEADLQKARDRRRAAAAETARGRAKAEREARADQARENLDVLRRQESLLKDDVKRLSEQSDRIGVAVGELDLKRREFEDAEAVVKRLRQEKERLRVEIQSTKQRVTKLYDAEPPRTNNAAAQLRTVGLAAAGGLFAGLGGVAVWGAAGRRIAGKTDVQGGLGLRVVGEMPWVPGGGLTGNPAGLSEPADALRTLLMPPDGGGGQVLLVTSAVPEEGKTTLACHLALSGARAGRRTLLVDCDLRRPRVHAVFNTPAGAGLAGVLRGAVGTAEAVVPGPVPGLSVLPAGDGSGRLTQTEVCGLRGLVADFRDRYDLVVIDCSPVLPVADALMIGRWVDGVLLSVRPWRSQVPAVAAACEQMAAVRLPVVGVVLNGVRGRRPDYRAYRYAQPEAESPAEVSTV